MHLKSPSFTMAAVLARTLLALLGSTLALTLSAQEPTATALKDEIRLPWTRSETRFIRQWQVLGEVPLRTPDAFAEDPFAGLGGEAALAPAKTAVALPGGSALHWREVRAWGDTLDLSSGEGTKHSLAAYAFAIVNRPTAGKALLCLGSDEGLRAWVNGKPVFAHRGPRSLTFDEDRVEVEMQAGANTLLLKVEQYAGPWTATARVLEPGALPPRVQEISPAILESSPSVLVVRTDATPEHAAEAAVEVSVVAAGGPIVAAQTVARGEQVRFDPTAWADGAYEIRCRTTQIDGRRTAVHLPWYRGDAMVAARRLVEAGKQADPESPAGLLVKMLSDLVLDRLGQAGLASTGNPWAAIHSPLMEYQELLLEQAGQPAARARAHGFVRLAWRDPVDGSPQFARAYLPRGYDHDHAYPLVLNIHGYNPANPDYVRWWGADSRHSYADTEYGRNEGMIYIEPHGRGNASYLGFADQDVMRVIALAKQQFKIDDDRVYLTGGSMGGWGTWNVANRHPQVFAAIAPVFGGSDYHTFLTDEQLAGLTPIARFLQDRQSSWSMAEALGNLPIFVVHGDVDQSVPVDYSRYGVRMLQRWGYNVRYHEMPGYGHEDLGGEMTVVFDWLLTQRRNPDPRHVRLRSAELRNATAYWMTVDQFERPDRFAVVDAEVVAPNTIRLDTGNVRDVTLSPGRALVDDSRPVQVVWNGVAHTAPLTAGRLSLHAADTGPAAALVKSARLPGGIGDVFATPFAIVVGTVSSDPAMKAMCQTQGEALDRYWRSWQHQPPRRFTDADLTDADAARYSLILIGGPEANLVTRKFAGRLPLEIAPDRIVIGGRAFPATDARVQMTYPNPLNPERYVLVIAANSAAGFRLWGPGTLSGTDFDFLIEDARVMRKGQPLPPSPIAVASGWFDRTWNRQDELIVAGDPKARADALLLQLSGPLHDVPRYVGSYEIFPGAVLKLTQSDQRLFSSFNGQTPAELIPAGPDTFFLAENSSVVVFQKDASGKPIGFTTDLGGRTYTGKRTE